MTLVMGMSYRDEFVIVSSDSRVVELPYGPLPKDFSMNDAKIADFKNEKVHLLNKKVLVARSGGTDGGDLLSEELFNRVKPHYDLGECAQILRQILAEAKEGSLSGYSSRAVDLVLQGSSNIDLYGFFDNGKTGAVVFMGHPYEREVQVVESPMQRAYPAMVHSPDDEDRAYFNSSIVLPAKEQRFENFISRFVKLHGVLSSKHHSVSSDCNIHYLRNKRGTIKYSKKTVETVDRHQGRK